MKKKQINLCRYAREGTLLAQLSIPTPRAPTPGLVTVVLTDGVVNLDPSREVSLVGFAAAGEMRIKYLEGICSMDFPGWIDVPIVVWLESRLKRKVSVVNASGCLEAARLALEHFGSDPTPTKAR